MENNISRIEYPLAVGAAFKADINGQGCFKCTAWINSDFIFAEAYGETEKEAEANASLIDDAVTIYNKSGKTPSELLEQLNELKSMVMYIGSGSLDDDEHKAMQMCKDYFNSHFKGIEATNQ